jgi:2-amino-4-hydroxy-6-hydroxymethyldihydropteridine diphosphokinase
MDNLWLLLGGDSPDSLELFNKACDILSVHIGDIASKSSVYASPPWGFAADTVFLNQALVFRTNKHPMQLLQICLDTEKKLGRTRQLAQEAYSSRSIDIDILYYGDKIINTAELQVPHPRLWQRRFALTPLCEINEDFRHPATGQSHKELLNNCPDTSEVTLCNH